MKALKNLIFITLSLTFVQCQCSKDSPLTVGTYNIRYKNTSDSLNGNGWQQRAPVIRDIIKYNTFDIIGIQEALHSQMIDLTDMLPDYSYIGVGRDNGQTAGEYAPIFYKKSKFTLTKSGHFWLSDITDAPNVGWDAALPRICTWGKFNVNGFNKPIWFFNLHMDHIGVEARKESARLVLRKIEEMCKAETVILTGDFNVDQTSDNYDILSNSSSLNDAFTIAKIRYATNGTFNNFNPNLKTESRIDHIFVSPDINIRTYGILTDTYRTVITNTKKITSPNSPKEILLQEYIARTPSDHFPVRVVVDF